MAWIYLVIAGLFECGWAIGLKYTEGFTRFMPSVLHLISGQCEITDGTPYSMTVKAAVSA
jgi:multidrug transporter EmrE-like cation transporter